MSLLLALVASGPSASASIAWAEENDGCAIAAASTSSSSLSWVEDDDVFSLNADAGGAANAAIAWIEDDDSLSMQVSASSGAEQDYGFVAWPHYGPERKRRRRKQYGIDDVPEPVEEAIKEVLAEVRTEARPLTVEYDYAREKRVAEELLRLKLESEKVAWKAFYKKVLVGELLAREEEEILIILEMM